MLMCEISQLWVEKEDQQVYSLDFLCQNSVIKNNKQTFKAVWSYCISSFMNAVKWWFCFLYVFEYEMQ